MKKNIHRLSASILLVSIIMTGATRPELIEKIIPKDAYTCQPGVDYSSLTFTPSGGSALTFSENNTCPSTKTYCASLILGALINTVRPCFGAGDVICCIRAVRDPELCPTFLFPYRIEIICKPQEA
ncbi:MAG: hypothetical protein P0Y53_01340 [Candidatus Pseudobacter hemicellulosilyticus]|uniref:Uncharacterized protein n=1 Tax=Candidatus Pseudobacter hemicellulosilyticus TaxID=3121375 RepID=A0AAJ5WQ61_9BACT|nr:MAG: hypothetical protein P0Y53_01340 [Pseudobacter sp.]